MKTQNTFNREEIKKIIPYKEPFLFIDEVISIEGNKIIGSYQTSEKDWYFEGHFVDLKIMPGVLVIEGLAQLASILLRKKIGQEHQNYHFLAYDVRSCQFFKPIFPGDKIELKCEVLGIYQLPNSEVKIARIKSQAFVNEELKAEARFSMAIIKKENFAKKYFKG